MPFTTNVMFEAPVLRTSFVIHPVVAAMDVVREDKTELLATVANHVPGVVPLVQFSAIMWAGPADVRSFAQPKRKVELVRLVALPMRATVVFVQASEARFPLLVASPIPV